MKVMKFGGTSVADRAAIERLVALVREAARPPTPRKKTRVSKAAKRRRVDDKKHHGAIKSLRSKRADD